MLAEIGKGLGLGEFVGDDLFEAGVSRDSAGYVPVDEGLNGEVKFDMGDEIDTAVPRLGEAQGSGDPCRMA